MMGESLELQVEDQQYLALAATARRHMLTLRLVTQV